MATARKKKELSEKETKRRTEGKKTKKKQQLGRVDRSTHPPTSDDAKQSKKPQVLFRTKMLFVGRALSDACLRGDRLETKHLDLRVPRVPPWYMQYMTPAY